MRTSMLGAFWIDSGVLDTIPDFNTRKDTEEKQEMFAAQKENADLVEQRRKGKL